jgi:hypothetical protein
MSSPFESRLATRGLSAASAQELEQHGGFTVIPGAAPGARLERLRDGYDAAMASATAADLKVGSTTTRLGGFVERGEDIEALFCWPPLLEACCRVIGGPPDSPAATSS